MPFLTIAGIEVLVTDLAEQEPTLIGDTGRSYSGRWRGDTSGEIRAWRGTGLEVAASKYHELRSAVRRGTVEVQGDAIYGGWSRRMRVTLAGEYVPSGTAYFIVPGFTMEDAGVLDLAYLLAPDRTTGWTFSRASTAFYIDGHGVLKTAASGVARVDHWVADGVLGIDRPGWLLEPGGTNLVTEPLDFSLWSQLFASALTVTGGQADPSGGSGAYLLNDDSTNDEGIKNALTTSFSVSEGKGFSIFVRQGTAVTSRLTMTDTTAGADRLLADLSWSGGEPAITMTLGTHVDTEELAGGWYRLLFRSATVTTGNAHEVRIKPAASASATGTLYVYGAQVEGPSNTSFNGGSRSVDILSRTLPSGTALPTDAWARYTRWVAGMDGAGGLAEPRIWQVGDGAHTTNLLSLHLVPDNIRLRHDNDTTAEAATIAVAIARGDTVETLVLWNGDGSASLIVSVNGAAPVYSASLSGITPASAWNGGANTYINSRDGGGNAGAMTLLRDAPKPGVPTGGTAEEYLRFMRGEAT